MKTAITELIETIETIVKLLPNEALGAKNQAIIIKTKAEELLKKEKNLSIEFANYLLLMPNRDLEEKEIKQHFEDFISLETKL